MVTNPGDARATDWLTTPLGLVRVTLRRGYDCRERCAHVPPLPNEGGENHGQQCDEWTFALRVGDAAATMSCYLWIRDGELQRWPSNPLHVVTNEAGAFDYRTYREQPIFGAYLVTHRKRISSDPAAAASCDILGHCDSDFAGYLVSAAFFDAEHCEALMPHAMQPVDQVDLAAVADAMRPLWQKLAGYLVATAED